MKKENNPVSQEKFKTLIGGQALIEGIMMQGPDKRSIVVRGPEGLVTKVEPLKKRTGSSLLRCACLPLHSAVQRRQHRCHFQSVLQIPAKER